MKNKKVLIFVFLLLGLLVRGQYVFNGTNKHKFTTVAGSIEIGPFNEGWAHIYSSMPKFIFNKPMYVIGGVYASYSDSDLKLQTNGLSRLSILNSNGNVGVGTVTPKSRLHITSEVRTALKVGGPRATGAAIADIYLEPSDGGSVGGARYWNWSFRSDSWSSAPGDLVLYSHNGIDYTSPVIFQSDGDVAFVTGNGASRFGNVGIGTASPDEKLTVKGTIHAQEVRVDLNGVIAPDYVFKKDYNLMSIIEIDKFIKEEGHLPNIPSASDMEKDGVKLKEMNLKLLEKIEELTLYTISQEKRLTKLEEQNKVLMDLMSSNKK